MRKTLVKRVMAFALSLMMVMGLLPTRALATEAFPGKPDGMSVSGSSIDKLAEMDNREIWLCPDANGSIQRTKTGSGYVIYEAIPNGGYVFSHWATWYVRDDLDSAADSNAYYQGAGKWIFSTPDSSGNKYKEKESKIRINKIGSNLTDLDANRYYLYAVFVKQGSVSIKVEGGGAIVQRAENTSNYIYGMGEYETYVTNVEAANFTVPYGIKLGIFLTVKEFGEIKQILINEVDKTATFDGSSFSVSPVESDLNIRIITSRDIPEYTITYHGNGGATEGGSVTYTQEYEHYDSPNLMKNQFSFGQKIFVGWSTKQDSITADYQDQQTFNYKGNIDLYAVWADQTYSVCFDGNGGKTVDGKTSYTQTCAFGVETMLTENGFAKDTSKFVCWNTKPDGTGTIYRDGQWVDLIQDLTLYAIWDDTTYDITFHGNGGKTADGKKTYTQTFVYEDAPNLVGNKFTYDSKSFYVWNTEPDGTGVTYFDQDIFSLNENIDLYAIWVTGTIPYVQKHWDKASQEAIGIELIVPGSAVTVSSSTDSFTNNWYVVNGDITINKRISVNGVVNLLITDGSTLTVNGGIDLADGNTLNIYGQTNGNGILNSNATASGGSIGGSDYKENAGTLTIHGGILNLNGHNKYVSGGISGGRFGNCGNVTIYGGTVTAVAGKQSAGIGGCDVDANGGALTIYGGTVTATGSVGIGFGTNFELNIYDGIVCATANAYSYPGIGGQISNINIYGGEVTAKGYTTGAGIGGNTHVGGSNVSIHGGTVTAIGGDSGGAGIGGGYKGSGGTVIITGGNIKAKGSYGAKNIGSGSYNDNSGTLTDGKGNSVSLTTITLEDASEGTVVTAVDGVTGYGLNDVKTLDIDKLYFYLPENSVPTGVTAGGEYYSGTVTNGAGEFSQHNHNWEYSVADASIQATCTASGCGNSNGGKITLSMPAYYTGDSVKANIEGGFTNGATYKVTYDGSDTAPSSLGSHTATLTVYENNVEKQSVTVTYTISYLAAPDKAYTISGYAYKTDTTYWYKAGRTATISAPSGYEISKTLGGDYSSSVLLSENEAKVIYLKRTSDGALTGPVTILEGIQFDGTAPTGTIQISQKASWQTLLFDFSYDLFVEGKTVATVAAKDAAGSGVKSVEYLVHDQGLSTGMGITQEIVISTLGTLFDNVGIDYVDKIVLDNNQKYVIYVRITDNVGNVSYLCSNGIVHYTDAQAETETVSVTYLAGKDEIATVKLNGNTIRSIQNGTTVLTAGTDYTVSGGKITLKAAYLDSLNEGSYTFTVSYDPLGLTFKTGDAPATTSFTVNVAKANVSNATVTVDGTFTYDGSAKTPEPVVVLEGKTLVKDTDYTVTYSHNTDAGEATVTVTGKGNYAGTQNKTFVIQKRPITLTASDQSKIYGEDDPTLTWIITSGTLVSGDALSDIAVAREVGENAGTYAITLSQAAGANKNYEITFVGGTFNISAKEVTATVTVNGSSFVYNGTPFEPGVVVKDGDTVISDSEYTVISDSEYTVSYSDNVKAGRATVTITDKDGGNYVVSGSATFTIEKADPVIGTVSVSGVVTDTTKPSEVVLSRTDIGVDGVLKLDRTDSEAMLADKAVYQWVFTPADTANYNVIRGDVSIDVLDTTAPTAVIRVDTNQWKQLLKNITFGLFFKDTQEVTITAADNENGSGIKELLYVVSDKELSDSDLTAVEWKTYTEAFAMEADGKFVVYAKAVDHDGNAVIVNSDGVVVDKTSAVVKGITDGGVYYDQLVFSVSDELAGVKSVVIDGVDKTQPTGMYLLLADNAQHIVTVTDNAGNVTQYTITIYKNYTVTYQVDGQIISTQTVGHGLAATVPELPAKSGYVGKWDRSNDNITADTVITAVYTRIHEESSKDTADDASGEASKDTSDSVLNAPHTGDNSSTVLWAALLSFSGSIILTLVLMNRRRKEVRKR